jgi:hypothetical protein
LRQVNDLKKELKSTRVKLVRKCSGNFDSLLEQSEQEKQNLKAKNRKDIEGLNVIMENLEK